MAWKDFLLPFPPHISYTFFCASFSSTTAFFFLIDFFVVYHFDSRLISFSLYLRYFLIVTLGVQLTFYNSLLWNNSHLASLHVKTLLLYTCLPTFRFLLSLMTSRCIVCPCYCLFNLPVYLSSLETFISLFSFSNCVVSFHFNQKALAFTFYSKPSS